MSTLTGGTWLMLLLKSYYIFNFIGVFCMPGTRKIKEPAASLKYSYGAFSIFNSFAVTECVLYY